MKRAHGSCKSAVKQAVLFYGFLLFCNNQALGQNEAALPSYPYGGVEDPLRYREWRSTRVALNFAKTVDFRSQRFVHLANLRAARFDSLVDCYLTTFEAAADLWGASFGQQAQFTYANFLAPANFRHAVFHDRAGFDRASFWKRADFAYATFQRDADFREAKFYQVADFSHADMRGRADFSRALLGEGLDFSHARVLNTLDLRDAEFGPDAQADFTLATIADTLLIGGSQMQRYDFLQAKLLPATEVTQPAENANGTAAMTTSPGATIILCNSLRLSIQPEKFKFIALNDTLNYFVKKDIIESLKSKDFAGNKEARFELDYIFARSTLYQRVSDDYEEYPLLHPTRWWRFIYNATMGLGYRPFRMAYFMAVLVLAYTLFYMVRIPARINAYISKTFGPTRTLKPDSDDEIRLGFKETLINCLYFSALTFFAFRLKGEYLTFFSPREKNSVISEWLVGFVVYILFVTLSKSGSIWHNLKSILFG